MALLEDGAWQGKIWTGSWTDGGGGTYDAVEPATGEPSVPWARRPPRTCTPRPGARSRRRRRGRPCRSTSAPRCCAGPVTSCPRTPTRSRAGWRGSPGRSSRSATSRSTPAPRSATRPRRCLSHPYGELLRTGSPRLSFARRLPAGVVGVIAPFNVPTILAIRAVAPALALGNAVILKPDPRTAISGGAMFARVFEEAGLPAGVLQVLPGGADVGEALVVEPAVRIIAFTGSTRAGRAVGALAGQHLKRAHLELGGNSALIVMPDVDVAAAASVGAWGTFAHSGPDLHGHSPAPGAPRRSPRSTPRSSPRRSRSCRSATRSATRSRSAR